MKLKGITAVITGSSGLLGQAVSKALAQAGCNCICHYYRNQKKAAELTEQIKKYGVEALAIGADFNDTRQIAKFYEKALEFAPPQILINSAAVFSRQRLEDIKFEQARRILDLNLIAPIMLSKLFAEQIKTKFGGADTVVGKIINISDVGGIRPWAEYAIYCASKAGLIGATKALAKELAPQICVNSIAPGVIERDGEFDGDRRQLSFIPVGRFGQAKDVTRAVIFLLENDYITGQVMNIDGGRCI